MLWCEFQKFCSLLDTSEGALYVTVTIYIRKSPCIFNFQASYAIKKLKQVKNLTYEPALS